MFLVARQINFRYLAAKEIKFSYLVFREDYIYVPAARLLDLLYSAAGKFCPFRKKKTNGNFRKIITGLAQSQYFFINLCSCLTSSVLKRRPHASLSFNTDGKKVYLKLC